MEDIRLKTIPYTFNGKEYQLSCNFNVLADIQAEFGEIPDLLQPNIGLKAYTVILSAMLNDYADTKGWKERYTPRQVGRTIDVKNLPVEDITNVVRLVIDALYDKKEDNTESKN